MTAVHTVQQCDELLQLRPGVYSSTSQTGELSLLLWQLWHRGEAFGRISAGQHTALRRLAEGRCGLDELRAIAGEHDDDPRGLDDFLEALRSGGWLMTTVRHQGRPLYTMLPMRRATRPVDPADGDLVLSRFAVVRREGDDLVVESPVASAQMQLHDPDAAALLCALARPLTQAPETAPGTLPAAAAHRMLQDLRDTGLAVPAAGATDEDTSQRLCQWRTHDLWFHQRSRMGNGLYFGTSYGRSDWGKERFAPLPARPDPYPGPPIALHRPDLDELRRRDPPLAAAVEDRHSTRVHDDDHPITADQLGELLYRCARIRGTTVGEDGVEYANRPYPSGGTLYELELYPVVRHVAGLRPGMYHYDAHEHQLLLVREPTPQITQMLRTASVAAIVRTPPQALIVISARFGRPMWRYEEMSYALTLKHVGVLTQTLYLAATAMGLAACALGAGDAMAFTEVTGRDHTVESSVGEFIVGSRPKS